MIDGIECSAMEDFPESVLRAVITKSNQASEHYKDWEQCS